MPRHVIIESMSGYEAARAAIGDVDVLWRTTSAALLTALPGMGQKVSSLEEELPQEFFDGLGAAAHEVAREFGRILNEACAWRGDYDLAAAFMIGIRESFFVTHYKGLLLSRAAEAARGEGGLLCVGNPLEPDLNGSRPGYARFDTLYAWLASEHGESCEVLEHVLDPTALAAMERGVTHRSLGAAEKLLSILTNTPGSFCFKLWKTLKERKLYPWDAITLWSKPRARFFLGRDCELLEEAFLRLLGAGARVEMLGALPLAGNPSDSGELPEQEELKAKYLDFAAEIMACHGVENDAIVRTCTRLSGERILRIVNRLRETLPDLEKGYEAATSRMQPGDAVLSNFFTAPEHILFHDFCSRKGFKVVSFEHGVTLGLSRWGRLADAFCGIKDAAVGVYHSRRAMEAMRPVAGGQHMILGGVPRTTARSALPGLMRFLARKWLGIGSDEHVVTYVADLDRNNFMYGPHVDNDLQYLLKTRAIVESLAAEFPESRILVKTYPTQRYVDPYEFRDLEAAYPNVSVVTDREYRFMREAADVTVFTSCQSTMGWVLGARGEHRLYEFEWAPCELEGAELPGPAIDGLRRVLTPTLHEVAGPAPYGYVSDLIRATR